VAVIDSDPDKNRGEHRLVHRRLSSQVVEELNHVILRFSLIGDIAVHAERADRLPGIVSDKAYTGFDRKLAAKTVMVDKVELDNAVARQPGIGGPPADTHVPGVEQLDHVLPIACSGVQP